MSKGLDIFLNAWKKIKLLNWELHIYGPDYDSYIDQLDPSLKKIDGVIFKGPLFDIDSKRQVFLNSDLMILPSKSENFGYVILESIRAGLPVLTTTQTPWENIRTPSSRSSSAPTSTTSGARARATSSSTSSR